MRIAQRFNARFNAGGRKGFDPSPEGTAEWAAIGLPSELNPPRIPTSQILMALRSYDPQVKHLDLSGRFLLVSGAHDTVASEPFIAGPGCAPPRGMAFVAQA